MFRFLPRLVLMLILPLIPFSLAACGGGGDDDDPAPAEAEVAEEAADGDEAPAPTMSGNWIGEFGTGVAFSMALVQSGDAITGTYATGAFDGTVTGTITGNAIEMTVVIPAGPTAKYTGAVNDARTSMNGSFEIIAGGGGSGTWSATK